MNWAFSPAWNPRLIAALAIGLVALAFWRWWRERRAGKLLFVRAAFLGILVLVMLNPEALLTSERMTRPKMILLLDTSSSMTTPDVGGSARISAALRVLTNAPTIASLNREFELDTRRFDRELRPVDLGRVSADQEFGDATDLGRALSSVVSELGDMPAQAGVLLVSDGRATTPGANEAAQLALARAVPIWTWCLGGPVPQHDLWIETASSEALAFSKAEVELTATLHATGYPNRSFKVELVKDDRVIESKEVLPDSRDEAHGTNASPGVRIAFRVTAPESGEERYSFRVAGQPDEADVANNERAVFVRAVGERVRVLVAEAQPSWDTKFLVQSLKRDPRVDVTAVYRLNATRRLTVVSAGGNDTRIEEDLFPRSASAMNRFDVIVLGRGAEAFFDSSTEVALTEFVNQHGGNLVFARGKPYGGRFQALAKFEPVAWGQGIAPAVRLQATDAGRENPIFDLGAAGTLDEMLERLPALDHASVTLGEKPLAVVLASGAGTDGPVLIAYQRYGQGRALSVNAGGLWRWDFRESGQEESELAYQRFWVSLLQWLLGGSQFLPGADVALNSTRRYYNNEQPMQFLISTRNLDRAAYQPRLAIEGGGKTIEVEPRPRGELFVAEAGPFPPGRYRVTLRNNVGKPAEISQNLEVMNASLEKRDLSADSDLMKKLASVSGGGVLSAADVARMPDVIRRWESARQLAHRPRPLWDRGWMLAGMVALLAVEWWLRRREGLL